MDTCLNLLLKKTTVLMCCSCTVSTEEQEETQADTTSIKFKLHGIVVRPFQVPVLVVVIRFG